MRSSVKHVLHTGREFVTHWAAAGIIVAATGVAPDHWMARLLDGLHLPGDALHLWSSQIDLRWVLLGLGLTLIVGDIAWRRTRTARLDTKASPDFAGVLALPDKPSIAVLPFANLTDDPAQEYFSDGITEDIITELSRFRALFVIARNSTFTYKGKPADVREVGRELGVRYVLEGSARKVGNRARVSAQLIEAATGNQLWAEHYERTIDDVLSVQEDITRGIVAAVAPEVELAQMALARHARPNDTADQLIWRAHGLLTEAVRQGKAAAALQAIELVRQAITLDPASLAAYNVLAWAQWSCHLYRWGSDPAKALPTMECAVVQMQRINALDHRTLTIAGVLHIACGAPDRGLVDLRRAIEVNPNSSLSLMWLALCEAMAGLGEDARTHAMLSLRLNPRDAWIGVAHLALAMVSFVAQDYAEATRWADLAIQAEPAAPLRRALMIACCARSGDLARAATEQATLNSVAPDFISSLFRGEFKVFAKQVDMAHLLGSLKLAG